VFELLVHNARLEKKGIGLFWAGQCARKIYIWRSPGQVGALLGPRLARRSPQPRHSALLPKPSPRPGHVSGGAQPRRVPPLPSFAKPLRGLLWLLFPAEVQGACPPGDAHLFSRLLSYLDTIRSLGQAEATPLGVQQEEAMHLDWLAQQGDGKAPQPQGEEEEEPGLAPYTQGLWHRSLRRYLGKQLFHAPAHLGLE
jgi:hypothetical protein